VTEKVLAVANDAGSMSSLKTALIAAFATAPKVGPGMVVPGAVSVTRGRVTSGVTPVLNVHTNLAASGMPVVSLAAVVTVALHVVLGGKFVASVSVAVLLNARYPTVPDTAVSTGHASVKLAVVKVAGSIALLKTALITFVLIGTPLALGTGATAVTKGAVPETALPRIVPCPPPISHPVTNTVVSNAMSRQTGVARLSNLFICLFFSRLIQENILVESGSLSRNGVRQKVLPNSM
jgi:hypothetical protein